MPDDVEDRSRPDEQRAAGRATPACRSCGNTTRSDGGRQIHDLWAERFVCETCGGETFRSYGRGSV